ncbi:ChaN family lipoprotein [Albimonas sp. CAU 1670]|uniref:ChaN family lipoprotein n=1 Tax=Albimonas sp. CAU 1670 TaxID=3032599 RepID=UPI0023DA41E0|nr:ChaN family lipoprotein [Albimonas sp. CAU 1670]MDF2233685.1 ChaN family lipoprotein [Albimonas sp. CAU 1670]
MPDWATKSDRTPWLADGASERLTWLQALDRMARAEILCLGEYHDRADIHRWQRDVIEGLLPFRSDLVVGLEMLPRSAQGALDAWISGVASFPAFLEATDWRRVWGFDPELYAPLFELARDRGLRLLALNVERSLVRRVGAQGWDDLPGAELEGLSPPAPASAAYRAQLFAMTGGRRPGREATSPEDPAFDRFVRAQQVWDRAFAQRLVEARALPGSPLVVGLIGRGHLERRLGVPEQLAALGAGGVAVALTLDAAEPEPEPGLADYLFRLPE